MKVVIIKYNAGNIKSVDFALRRIGIKAEITDDIETIQSAEKVIFPGVGEASTAMHYLKNKNLDQLLPNLKQPVLGICLGMQLMGKFSAENKTNCLGIFDFEVKKFKNVPKIPHMGWNELMEFQGNLFKFINEKSYVYFVHSYYCEINQYTTSVCNYGFNFSASLKKDNFYATQFHPEKSGEIGSQILKNFIEL
jgi:imidazole glycerol-phosphate synthase subunit HisH